MNNFDKNWRNAQKNIFRLEGRAEYRLPGEWENFEKWKQGNLDLGGDTGWQKWIESLKKARTKGAIVQRVRVVKNLISDYIKFEIDLWQKYSVKAEVCAHDPHVKPDQYPTVSLESCLKGGRRGAPSDGAQ